MGQGTAPGKPVRGAGRPYHTLRAHHRAGLVWRGERAIEVSSATAVCRHGGIPTGPIRWVLTRNPLGRFDPQAHPCTDQACDPVQVLRWCVQRWQMEVAFRGASDRLGVRCSASGWTRPSHARRSACSSRSPCWRPSSRPKLAGPQQPAPGAAGSTLPFRHTRRRPPVNLAGTGFCCATSVVASPTHFARAHDGRSRARVVASDAHESTCGKLRSLRDRRHAGDEEWKGVLAPVSSDPQ